MKILVVGGTGMIGGHAALHLSARGHDVTVSGRNPPQQTTGLAKLPFLKGDYITGTFTEAELAPFEVIVFAAGNDIRHVPKGGDLGTHALMANGEKVPEFAKLARQAGVRQLVHVGSYYPHVTPQLMATDGYIRSRKMATDGILALETPSFKVVSLDAPFVLGTIPGMSLPMFEAYTKYAEGKLGIPAFGPAGATNFISCLSLSEAITTAVEQGLTGKAILVGDENLTYAAYFELFFRAAGNEAPVPSLDQEHPMLPDSAMPLGRGGGISYEPPAAETKLLNYRRNDIARAVKEIVDQYKSAA
jgi:dihydroflavonol-4-reductase